MFSFCIVWSLFLIALSFPWWPHSPAASVMSLILNEFALSPMHPSASFLSLRSLFSRRGVAAPTTDSDSLICSWSWSCSESQTLKREERRNKQTLRKYSVQMERENQILPVSKHFDIFFIYFHFNQSAEPQTDPGSSREELLHHAAPHISTDR